MLNSAGHEISNAHKYKNIKSFSFFSGSDKPKMIFFLLLNVKMQTIVGILTLISRKNFILSMKILHNLGAWANKIPRNFNHEIRSSDGALLRVVKMVILKVKVGVNLLMN